MDAHDELIRKAIDLLMLDSLDSGSISRLPIKGS